MIGTAVSLDKRAASSNVDVIVQFLPLSSPASAKCNRHLKIIRDPSEKPTSVTGLKTKVVYPGHELVNNSTSKTI